MSQLSQVRSRIREAGFKITRGACGFDVWYTWGPFKFFAAWISTSDDISDELVVYANGVKLCRKLKNAVRGLEPKVNVELGGGY